MKSENDEIRNLTGVRTMESELEEGRTEEAVEISPDRINPDTLRKMIEEFVTREWSELTDSGFTLDENIEQVLRQLKERRARIVYNFASETWNIIPSE